MELGWALPRRVEYFREAERQANETYRIRFQGDHEVRKLFLVPIGLPKYRLENGRTVSLQAEWLADHPSESPSFFRTDPESDRAQGVQHSLLLNLIKGKGLKEFFADAVNKQVEPVILDANGFVVNGNRRLCCWRDLYEVDPSRFAHFSHIRVIVLPPADGKAIDRLEAELQIAQDIRDEYSWDTLANMLYERREQHGYSEDDLAELYDKSVVEIRALLEMREYALQYMASRGCPNHWTKVRGKGTDYAFRKILKARRQASSAIDKRIIENVAFALLDEPEGFGRLYDAIPRLGDELPKLKKRLSQDLPIAVTGEGRLRDSTGFFDDEDGTPDEAALLTAVEAEGNRGVLREVARDVIEESRLIENEEKTATYLRKKLQRANSEVQHAVNAIGESASRAGVREQIDEIEGGLRKLKEWLGANS